MWYFWKADMKFEYAWPGFCTFLSIRFMVHGICSLRCESDIFFSSHPQTISGCFEINVNSGMFFFLFIYPINIWWFLLWGHLPMFRGCANVQNGIHYHRQLTNIVPTPPRVGTLHRFVRFTMPVLEVSPRRHKGPVCIADPTTYSWYIAYIDVYK